MTKQTKNIPGSSSDFSIKDVLLWIAAVILGLGVMIVRTAFPEMLWLTILAAVLFVGVAGVLIMRNRAALRHRTTAYGVNSVITVLLVISILGVINFLAFRHPKKIDLTKNKVHSLAEQSIKVVQELKNPVKATLFANPMQKEQSRTLLDNYRAAGQKFELEYADPNRDFTRVKQLGIKRLPTLYLAAGAKDARVEDPNEEKVTNALIKMSKDKSPTLCPITGHGERNFSSTEPDGYDSIKKALGNQAYEIKDLNLASEGKVPDHCDAVAVIGPTKGFLEQEIKILKDYLANGGRAIVAADINPKGGETSQELISVLEPWHVKPTPSLILDPTSRVAGADMGVTLIGGISRDHPTTKELAKNRDMLLLLFPLSRPLEIVPGAPAGMNVQWLAQTTPYAVAVSDFKELNAGKPNLKDGKKGPFSTVVSVEGKLPESKATRNTRMVVFGSSIFATNQFGRIGGNFDLFLNAVSWILEDESLISIRAKDEGPGRITMSQTAAVLIFWGTVAIIPILTLVFGVLAWVWRRRL